MNKSLFAIIFAVSLLTATAPHAVRAQMQTNQVYSASQMFNQSFGNMQVWRNAAEMRRRSKSEITADTLSERRGANLIRKGNATMKFAMRAFPYDFWMKNTRVDTSISPEEDRRARLSGMQKQNAYFASQMSRFGAQSGDMADMMSVATIICVEIYTGQKVKGAVFRTQSELFSKAWLRDNSYQGKTLNDKQEYYERAMLSATYSWYLLAQKEDKSGARQYAVERLAEWFGDAEKVLTAYKPFLPD